MTPLSHAALGGHLEVVRCLAKELGANVNQANGDGSTPLLIAAYLGDVDMVRCLIEELGADINKANKVGATSLFIAAEQGHLNMVICLGELGADLNLATYTCLTTTLTPLMVPLQHIPAS
jgi:ankyrin repeat protein